MMTMMGKDPWDDLLSVFSVCQSCLSFLPSEVPVLVNDVLLLLFFSFLLWASFSLFQERK